MWWIKQSTEINFCYFPKTCRHHADRERFVYFLEEETNAYKKAGKKDISAKDTMQVLETIGINLAKFLKWSDAIQR